MKYYCPAPPCIIVGSPQELALEESNVDDGSVVVDELEEINLECERVIEVCLSSVELLLCQPDGDGLVDEVEQHDEDQVDGGPCGCDEDGPVTPGSEGKSLKADNLPSLISSYLINWSVTVARATIMDIL